MATVDWPREQCCMCGEQSTEDPALVVRIDGAIVGYLCSDAHDAGGIDPALSRIFVTWVRERHPGKRVLIELPGRGASYTINPEP